MFLKITASLLSVMAMLCAGCSVQHDSTQFAGRRVGGARVEPTAGEDSILAAERNPALIPSAREQRIVRAMAEYETEMVLDGAGMMLYRWDGSASRPNGVQYVASPGALTVNYEAAANLNCIDGEPHALRLVVYHLSDRAAFDQLTGHAEGIRKLLEGGRFDESVKRVREYDVQPGSKGQLLFDRPEGGKFVAIVAGYGDLTLESSIYVTEYGVGRWATPGLGNNFRPRFMFVPLPLTIDVQFGRLEIAAKNSGKMLGTLQKTRDLTFSQMRHRTWEELGFFKKGVLITE